MINFQCGEEGHISRNCPSGGSDSRRDKGSSGGMSCFVMCVGFILSGGWHPVDVAREVTSASSNLNCKWKGDLINY